MTKGTTFGQVISAERKEKGLSQKDLASAIKREDGSSISPQYLNDIEHDRRSPSSDHLVGQFSKVLGVDLDYLYYLADRLPKDIRKSQLSQEEVSQLMVAFRKSPRSRGKK